MILNKIFASDVMYDYSQFQNYGVIYEGGGWKNNGQRFNYFKLKEM